MGRTRTLAQRERDLRALELRRMSLGYAQIAKQMGWRSQASAYEAVQRALADALAEPAAAVIQLAEDRLDEMARVLRRVIAARHYLAGRDGRAIYLEYDDEGNPSGDPVEDHQPIIQAVMALLKVEESRRKLRGTDAPARQRIEVVTTELVADWITQLERDLADAGRPALPAGHTGLG